MVINRNKYKNKYRIATTRFQYWDYGWNAAYFITICTKNHINYFGNVINQTMRLTDIGKIAEKFWIEIPDHFTFVQLDKFIVMPNHVHGIIIIDKKQDMIAEQDIDNKRNIMNNPEIVGEIEINDNSQIIGERNVVETLNLGVSTTWVIQKP